MKRIFVFIVLFVFGSGFAHAESFFENFSDDPTASGWLDASIKRDSTGVVNVFMGVYNEIVVGGN
jgi:hypothetical protein